MLQFIANLLRKPAPRAAADQPRSQKHVRVTVWSDRVTVAYYGHGGRKLTARSYPIARHYAMVKRARANGYRVCGS